MALKEIGIGFLIGGTIASTLKSSLKFTNTSIAKIDENINSLNKTKVEIKNFKKLKSNASANKKELSLLGNRLKKTGIDANNLSNVVRNLNKKLLNLKKASRIHLKLEANKEQFSNAKASILGVGATIWGFKSTVSSANDVLKSQGEIASLDISEKGIKNITSAAANMSLKFGQLKAPDFIKASYDIKSGIASLSEDGVKDFTKLAATTAVATKARIEDMTKLYALGYGIFRDDFGSDLEFGKKFSGAIAGAVQAFRTDGADLAQGISNIGASAKAMGVSLEEELSIIGLAKKAFNSASEAGSGYRGFLAGVGKAQKKLGLSFVDSQGKMLPMVEILKKIKDKYGDLDLKEMGKLKEAFGSEEAIKIISALIPKTDELTKSQANLKKQMSSNIADKMASKMDRGYGFEKMSNAMSYMAYTIGKSVEPAVELFATGLGKLAKGIAFLDEKVTWLMPTIAGVAGAFIGLFTVVKTFALSKLALSFALNSLTKSFYLNKAEAIKLNKVYSFSNIKTKLQAFWTGILNVKTKALAVSQAILNKAYLFSKSALKSIGLKAYSIALGVANVGSKALATGTLFLNKAFTIAKTGVQSLIGATGIGLLLVAAGLVYEYWTPIKSFFKNLWINTKKIFNQGINFIKDKLSWTPLGMILNNWTPIKKFFINLWADTKTIFNGFINFVSNMFNAPLNTIKNLWSGLFDWLSSKFEWIGKSINWVKDAGSKITGLFNDDEDDKKDEKEKTKKKGFFSSLFLTESAKHKGDDEKKPIRTGVKKIALASVTSTALVASPIPAHKVKEQQIHHSKKQSNSINHHNYTINITVNNPKSEIDIQKAVKKALKDIQRDKFNREIS